MMVWDMDGVMTNFRQRAGRYGIKLNYNEYYGGLDLVYAMREERFWSEMEEQPWLHLIKKMMWGRNINDFVVISRVDRRNADEGLLDDICNWKKRWLSKHLGFADLMLFCGTAKKIDIIKSEHYIRNPILLDDTKLEVDAWKEFNLNAVWLDLQTMDSIGFPGNVRCVEALLQEMKKLEVANDG